MSYKEQVIDNDRRQEYVSSRGVKVVFSPMPVALRERIVEAMRNDGWEEPTVPTYEVDVLDGADIEIHEHDETTIVGDEEATKLWEEFKEKEIQFDQEANTRLNKACRILCTEVPDLDDDKWVKEQEFLGFNVPTDPLEKKLYYIENVFIGTKEDVVAIIQFPLRLTMQRTGALKAAEEMFRKALLVGKDTNQNIEEEIGESEMEMAGGGTDGSADVGTAKNGTRVGKKTK